MADVNKVNMAQDEINPYMFEPEYPEGHILMPNNERQSEEGSSGSEDEVAFRLRDTEWCDCGNCQVMQTVGS
jgi:hypothetical protein